MKNEPYLDNFVTNPIHILAYSGNLGSESPEYVKIYMGLVTKLSRYGSFLTQIEDKVKDSTKVPYKKNKRLG